MTGAHLEDVRPSDLAVAAGVAFASLLVAALALSLANVRRADAPIIDPGTAAPIRVKPVLDVTTPSGGKGEAALPANWARPEPPPPPIAPETVPPPTSEPPKPRRPRPNKPAQPQPPGEPPPSDEPAPEGAATDGGTDTEGDGGGGPDPLGARAIAAYRERLIQWLAARFEVRGSGLTREELGRMRVSARIEISEDGLVQDYTILSADHPAFEAAARVALDAIKGEPVPPPPEYYPGALQRRIKVTFVCTDSTCD